MLREYIILQIFSREIQSRNIMGKPNEPMLCNIMMLQRNIYRQLFQAISKHNAQEQF